MQEKETKSQYIDKQPAGTVLSDKSRNGNGGCLNREVYLKGEHLIGQIIDGKTGIETLVFCVTIKPAFVIKVFD